MRRQHFSDCIERTRISRSRIEPFVIVVRQQALNFLHRGLFRNQGGKKRSFLGLCLLALAIEHLSKNGDRLLSRMTLIECS